ncbi:MAG: hypothetical protein WCV50_00710 [Patescibacteria group bacterium]|jgi:hypothetical protein
MPDQNPIKNSPKNIKIILLVMAIIIIGLAVVVVVLMKTNKNSNESNKSIVVANSNANSDITVVNNTIANQNTNVNGNTNASQVVVQTNGNTNQTVINTAVNSNQQNVIIAAKTINDTAVQLIEKQTGHCQALAPEDWSFTGNAESTGTDLYSPDKSQHAGWGIAVVYKYMYPDAESFLTAWLSYAFTGSFTSGGFTLGEPKDIYEGFIQRDFTTSTGRQGAIIYKTYNFSDPTTYVVSVYMADTPNDKWDSSGALPFSVALTIRCVSQLRPVTSSVDVSTPDPSDSADNPEVSLSDKWTEAIMGYENVYSPTTGEHYEAPLNSQWDGGPQGSGYYRSLPGGGYEKLERGFGF